MHLLIQWYSRVHVSSGSDWCTFRICAFPSPLLIAHNFIGNSYLLAPLQWQWQQITYVLPFRGPHGVSMCFSMPHRHLSLDEKWPALKQPIEDRTHPSMFCDSTKYHSQAQSIIITTIKDCQDCSDNSQWPFGLHNPIVMISKSCGFTLDTLRKIR